jgi:hypothetical protein
VALLLAEDGTELAPLAYANGYYTGAFQIEGKVYVVCDRGHRPWGRGGTSTHPMDVAASAWAANYGVTPTTMPDAKLCCSLLSVFVALRTLYPVLFTTMNQHHEFDQVDKTTAAVISGTSVRCYTHTHMFHRPFRHVHAGQGDGAGSHQPRPGHDQSCDTTDGSRGGNNRTGMEDVFERLPVHGDGGNGSFQGAGCCEVQQGDGKSGGVLEGQAGGQGSVDGDDNSSDGKPSETQTNCPEGGDRTGLDGGEQEESGGHESTDQGSEGGGGSGGGGGDGNEDGDDDGGGGDGNEDGDGDGDLFIISSRIGTAAATIPLPAITVKLEPGTEPAAKPVAFTQPISPAKHPKKNSTSRHRAQRQQAAAAAQSGN